MINRRSTLKGLAAGAAALATGSLLAQDSRTPINVIVGAASSMDFTARVIADQLREALGRPTVVTPRLGAAQRLALGEVKRAAPDGNTLLVATSGPFTIFPNIFTGLDYDAVKDFTPIVGVTKFDVAMAASLQSGIKNMKEFIAWGKKQTGPVVYGVAPGTGSLSHFCAINIAIETGVKMEAVPYKDSGVGITDTISGRIPLMFTGLAPLAEMHRSGRIRLLAVSGGQRSPRVPDVPTLKESGVNVESTTAVGVFGPAGMSADVVKRLHDAIVPMLSKADVVEKLANQSMVIAPATGPQFEQLLVQEREHYAKLVKLSGFERQAL